MTNFGYNGNADETLKSWAPKLQALFDSLKTSTGDGTPRAAASHTHPAADIVSGTLADARVAESNVTQHEGAINHDALLNYSSNEHLDWTQDLGATNINNANIPVGAITQHFEGWTSWSPTFSGGNGVTLSSGSSITEAAYCRIPTPSGDDLCSFFGQFSVNINSSGGSVTLSLPVGTTIANNTYIATGQRSTGSWTTRRQLIALKQGSVMFLEADAGVAWSSSTTYLVTVCGHYRIK